MILKSCKTFHYTWKLYSERFSNPGGCSLIYPVLRRKSQKRQTKNWSSEKLHKKTNRTNIIAPKHCLRAVKKRIKISLQNEFPKLLLAKNLATQLLFKIKRLPNGGQINEKSPYREKNGYRKGRTKAQNNILYKVLK